MPTVLFFLEGLYRSRLMPVMFCGIMLAFTLMFALAEHTPLSVQRSLSVLPLYQGK